MIYFYYNRNTVDELHEKYHHQKLNKVLSKYSKCSRSVGENEFYNKIQKITSTRNSN